MNSQAEKFLMKNEKVLWEGKAEAFQLLDAPYRTIFPIIWGVTGVITAAFIGLYLPFFFRSGSTLGQFAMAFLCFMAVPLFVSLEPFALKRSLEKKITYVLTDKRAMVVNNGKAKIMNLEKGTPVRIEKLSNGSDILYIGESACNSSTYSSRANAVHGFHDADKEPDDYAGLIFYSIKNADQVYDKMAV